MNLTAFRTFGRSGLIIEICYSQPFLKSYLGGMKFHRVYLKLEMTDLEVLLVG